MWLLEFFSLLCPTVGFSNIIPSLWSDVTGRIPTDPDDLTYFENNTFFISLFILNVFPLCYAFVCAQLEYTWANLTFSFSVSNNEHVHLFPPGAFIHNLARKP